MLFYSWTIAKSRRSTAKVYPYLFSLIIHSSSTPSCLPFINRSAGATYDSIEGRFRIIKKDAKVLKDEIENGIRPEAPARGPTNTSFASTISEPITPKKPRGKKTTAGSPTPKKEKVLSGRVSKNGTPAKSVRTLANYGRGMAEEGENVVKGIKQEAISSGSSLYGGEEDAMGDVFEGLDLRYEQMEGI